jgi:hypothetical protein
MPIDYVSTAAWNDPFNPWPAYAQLTLSAADAALNASGMPLIMQLTNFDPSASPANGLSWVYQSLNQPNPDAVYLRYIRASNEIQIGDDEDGVYYVIYNTAVRSIPAGWQQGNTAWEADNGADVTTLSIIADTTVLTPWEKRRIAGGTG